MRFFFGRGAAFAAAALASMNAALAAQEGGEGPGDAAVEAAALLREAVSRIDPDAKLTENGAEFTVAGTKVTLVYDINADRMRLVAPVAEAASLGEKDLMRLLQADFDSALDARYAIAHGVLWSTFIHPLSSITGEEFGSGVGQTVNLVATFGATYSSGLFVFGGGDSAEEQRKLIEELEQKGSEI